MNRIDSKAQNPIFPNCQGSLTPGDQRIRALFVATIALGACLLVAGCYHVPYSSILDATGFGLTCVSVVAYGIQNARVSKPLRPQEPSLPETLEGQDLTTLPPDEMRVRIRRMTEEQRVCTRNNLREFIDNPRKRRGTKISKEVAEILILNFEFDKEKVSRIVKPDELSAYETHPLLTLSPKEMETAVKEMSPEQKSEARKHVTENLKILRIPFNIRYVLAVHLGVDPTLVYEKVGDSSCSAPYSLLEMGLAPQLITFETVEELMGATQEQRTEQFNKIPSERIEEIRVDLKKRLPTYDQIPDVAFQFIAVGYEVDLPAIEKAIEYVLRGSLFKDNPEGDLFVAETRRPTPKPLVTHSLPAPKGSCGDEVKKVAGMKSKKWRGHLVTRLS